MATLKSIDHELSLLTARLRDVRETMEAYLLSLSEKPDDPDLPKALAELETTEANISRQIDRLNRTKAAMERRTVEANADARVADMRAKVAAVNKLGDQMEREAEAILDAIDKLGPILQRYESLSVERAGLAHAVIREGEHKLGAFADSWSRYRQAATLKEAPASLAMTAALWQHGLGKTGPDVGSLFEVPGPNFLGPFKEGADVRGTMREHFAKARDKLQSGMDRAIEVVIEQGKKQAHEERSA
jgi:hypothetical protein